MAMSADPVTEDRAAYAHLLNKPVEAMPCGGSETVRGILRDGEMADFQVMLYSFTGRSAQWQPWTWMTEVGFGDLSDWELAEWSASDPKGYFLAGYAWARDMTERGANNGR